MYPWHAVNAFLSPHLFSLASIIESRVGVDSSDTAHPFYHLFHSYSLFDWKVRLPELIRNDPHVCDYLLHCVVLFEARGCVTLYPDYTRVATEVQELKRYLTQRRCEAMRPARL